MKKLAEKLRGLRKRRGGFTLIETVVSIALIALICVLMASVFMTGIGLIGTARGKTSRVMNAAGATAQATVSGGTNTYAPAVSGSASSGSFTVDFGTAQATASGSYRTSTDGDASIKSFVPAS